MVMMNSSSSRRSQAILPLSSSSYTLASPASSIIVVFLLEMILLPTKIDEAFAFGGRLHHGLHIHHNRGRRRQNTSIEAAISSDSIEQFLLNNPSLDEEAGKEVKTYIQQSGIQIEQNFPTESRSLVYGSCSDDQITSRYSSSENSDGTNTWSGVSDNGKISFVVELQQTQNTILVDKDDVLELSSYQDMNDEAAIKASKTFLRLKECRIKATAAAAGVEADATSKSLQKEQKRPDKIDAITPDLGEKVLQRMTEMKEEIKDIKVNQEKTQQRYDELENRISMMELLSSSSSTSASVVNSSDNGAINQPSLAEPDCSSKRKGWYPVDPDPKEPFCSLSGKFMWLGSDRDLLKEKTGKATQEPKSAPPTMIATATAATMGIGGEEESQKIALLVENQQVLTNQLQSVISQLRLVSTAQQQQSKILQDVTQDNLNLLEMLSGVKEDVSDAKLQIQNSIEQYQNLDSHLDTLGGSSIIPTASNEDENETSSIKASSPRDDDIEAVGEVSEIVKAIGRSIVSSKMESNERRTTDPKVPAPFCSFEGTFIWVAADIE